MSVYFYHEDEKRWLTSYEHDSKQGSVYTTSVGHPTDGGEFTTYRLGPVVARNKWGDACFDMSEAEIQMPDGQFFPAKEVRAIAEGHPKEFTLGGTRYERTAFFNYRMVKA